MKNLFSLSIILFLLSLNACKIEENLTAPERADFPILSMDEKYDLETLEGFAKLIPYKGGVVLTLQGDKEDGDHSFVLQSKTSLLEKEKILGEGKVYWIISKERAQMYEAYMPHSSTPLKLMSNKVIYFEGKEQLSLQISDAEPVIKLLQSYEGYGLAYYPRIVDAGNL